jgi:tellurite methyltransferase
MYYGWDVRQEFREFLEQQNFNYTSALDLGSGEGRYSFYLADAGCVVTAVDASEVALEKLTRLALQRGLRIKTHLQDVADFTYQESRFELVIAATILDHLDGHDRTVVVQGIKQTLKPGGIIYANVFTKFDPGYLERVNGPIVGRDREISDTAQCIEHYFDSGELQQLFSDFQTLYYYEGIEPDLSHGAPHYHGSASLIAQKRLVDKTQSGRGSEWV